VSEDPEVTSTQVARVKSDLTGPLEARTAVAVGGSAVNSGRRDVRFLVLAAAVCLEAVGVGVLFPLLASIQREDHLATYGLGLMSGASFFAGLVAQLGVGPFLDGSRARRVLLGGLALGAVSQAWFASVTSLWSLVGARACGGIAFGIILPAALRQAGYGQEGPDRGRRLGAISASMMAGITVGPLLGSVLYSTGGIHLPFIAVAVLLGVVFVLAVVLIPGSQGADDVTEPLVSTGNRSRRTSFYVLVSVVCLGAASQLPNGLYDALWSRLMTDRGAGALLIGLSLTLYGAPFIVLAPIGGRLAEKRGPLLAGAVGLMIADVFMASYGFVPSPVVITLLGVGEACVQSVAVPAGYAYVARVFPQERAATGQGLFGGAGTAAAGLSAVLGASLYAQVGPGAVFAGGAAASAALAAVALGVGRSPRNRRPWLAHSASEVAPAGFRRESSAQGSNTPQPGR